jgi:hypothetical protein
VPLLVGGGLDSVGGVRPYGVDTWFSSMLGQNLGSAVLGLLMFPMWAVVLGLVGSAIGRSGASPRLATAR